MVLYSVPKYYIKPYFIDTEHYIKPYFIDTEHYIKPHFIDTDMVLYSVQCL
jgi:hypothetical protein